MMRPKRNFDNYGYTRDKGKQPELDGSDRRIKTPLGEVRVLNFKYPIPKGFRKMRIEEGRVVKKLLMPILTNWSIVAFEIGVLLGSGYGGDFSDDSWIDLCGEGFIIQEN